MTKKEPKTAKKVVAKARRRTRLFGLPASVISIRVLATYFWSIRRSSLQPRLNVRDEARTDKRPSTGRRGFLIAAKVVTLGLVIALGWGLAAQGIQQDLAARSFLASDFPIYLDPVQMGVSLERPDAEQLASYVEKLDSIPGDVPIRGWEFEISAEGEGSLSYFLQNHGDGENLELDSPLAVYAQLPNDAELTGSTCGGWISDEETGQIEAEVVSDGANIQSGGAPLTIKCTMPAVGRVFMFNFSFSFSLPSLPEFPHGLTFVRIGNPYWPYRDDPTSSWARTGERDRPTSPISVKLAPRPGDFVEWSSKAVSPGSRFESSWVLDPDESLDVALRDRAVQADLARSSQFSILFAGIIFGLLPSVIAIPIMGRHEGARPPGGISPLPSEH